MTAASDTSQDNVPVSKDSYSPPSWVAQLSPTWGTPLHVPEWTTEGYRDQNGWHGHDYMHDADSAVRILEYSVRYGDGIPGVCMDGGVGTTLIGPVYFSKRAESHAGYCHGGTMCSVLDDAVGWCAFVVTGQCVPWSGFTVQINTSLCRPIPVRTTLLVTAKVVRMERRKVSVEVELSDPANGNVVHAKGDGLVILNRGVLPEDTTTTS